MKYLLFIVGFVVFSIVFGLWWVRRCHKRALKVCLTCFFEKKAHPFSRLNLFLSIFIDLTADFILRQPRKIKNQIIDELQKGRCAFLIKTAKIKEPALAQALKLLFETKTVHAKKMPKKAHFASEKIIRCLWLESVFDFEALNDAVKSLPRFYTAKRHRIIKKMLQARILFFQTDLQKASKHLMGCVPYFYKKGFLDETAYCYFLLGEMYRLTQTYDVAEMLFDRALKIYHTVENDCGIALINLVKGILLLEEKRFDEAKDNLSVAEKLYRYSGDEKALADVLYFLTLAYQGQNDTKKAQATFKKLKRHIKEHHLSFLYAEADKPSNPTL